MHTGRGVAFILLYPKTQSSTVHSLIEVKNINVAQGSELKMQPLIISWPIATLLPFHIWRNSSHVTDTLVIPPSLIESPSTHPHESLVDLNHPSFPSIYDAILVTLHTTL